MRDLLASSQYWQMICLMPGATFEAVKAAVDANSANATTLAAAKVRIVGDLMPEEMIGDDEDGCFLEPPRALMRYQQDSSITRTTTSGTNRSDGIVFSLELPVPEQYRSREPELITSGYVDFLNKAGKVIEDMQASVINGGIQIETWQRVGKGLTPPEQIGGQWVRWIEHIATFTGVC
jgi:hypothetical protein